MSGPTDSGVTGGDGPGGTRSTPKAVVHKQILDAAAADPDASIEELASAVSGASVDLVERVLDEYGDPAGNTAGSDDEQEAGSGEIGLPGGQGDGPAGDGTPATTDGGTESQHGTAAGVNEGTDPGTAATEETAVETSTDGPDDGSGGSDATGDDDPADGGATEGDEGASGESGDASTAVRDPAALSDRQLETLRAVAADPTATQADVADRLDVSRATIANRLRDLDGFEWSERRRYVERLFESTDVTVGSGDSTAVGTAGSADDTESGTRSAVSGDDANPDENGAGSADRADRIGDETDRLDTPVDGNGESRDEAGENTDRSQSPDGPFADPELVHKVVHACMDAEYVTEEEELRILKSLLE